MFRTAQILKKFFYSLLLVAFMVVPIYGLFAIEGDATPPPNEDTTAAEFAKLKNPLAGTVDSIPSLIREILDIIVLIGVPIVAIMIIVSGLRLVLAQGKPEELSKARQGLLWTIVGAAIVLGAYAISEAIGSTVGELVAFTTILYV